MSVESIRARLEAGGSRRPLLFRWLYRHHAEMRALIAAQGRGVDWTAIAEELAALGITGGQGKPPTAQMVRQTWWKVTRHARRMPPPSQKREPVPPVFVEGGAPVPPAARAVPPSAADPLGHIKAGWAAGKTPMPKPIK